MRVSLTVSTCSAHFIATIVAGTNYHPVPGGEFGASPR
jgi:hypothetical protein